MCNILMSLLLCLLFMSGGVLNQGLKEDANMSSCIEAERQALLDVKANLIDLHGNLTDWANEGENMDCCKWVGVTCNNRTGHVIKLDLKFDPSGFTGNISLSLQVLNQLQYLDMSNIDFQFNPLPDFLGTLSNLQHLDISHANLSGTIPHQLAKLSNLLRLDLSRNSLGGSIPLSFGDLTSLTYLDLSQNQLRGDITKTLGNCSSLVHLDLSQNLLNGSMPASFGQLSNLRFLDFSSNYLEGVISEVHFLNLTQLDYLDLSLNSLALDVSFPERIPFQLSTIKLRSCKLGPRFPVWIRTQRDFKHLDISSAGISDSAPAWFWDLPTGLEILNISSNQIKGMLPNITSSFPGNVALDLSKNHFEGRVPLLPFRLAALNLSGNRFSGTLSFLCGIETFLSFLDLSNNLLSGSLPDCLGKLSILKILNLSNNNFSGEIPSSLGSLLTLEALYLRTNAFVGELPVSLSNCIRIRFLDLGENKLSGVIPEWIGESLSELYVLALGSNRFHGRLPSQVCFLNNLQVLDLSNNQLLGNLPRCFSNLTAMARRSFGDDMTNHSYLSYIPTVMPLGPGSVLSSESLTSEEEHFLDNALVKWKGTKRSFKGIGLQLLKSFDLSRNNFSGVLSYEITSLYDVASLNLSYNKLHGEVPKDIGQLKALESLDLSRNEFSGHIPLSLAQISSLSYLDLSSNNLSGRIPTGTQLQSFDNTSYTGNPQLCGPPLTQTCGFPPVVEKKEVEEDDDFWKSYYIGMGAGFAVGFLGICGALVLSLRCRYFFFASLSRMKDWIYVIVVVHFGKLERKFRR
ncbi:receptor-like protein EIX1 [Bidens hawaiensis]|uniref:receptor-like protein EIX1 n=1 Tax=Bidens hawaiensis TaxID=980011 RepID=UPI004049D1FF